MGIANSIIKTAKPIVEKFPRLAAAYRTVRDSSFVVEEPKVTPFGFKFSGHKSMMLGQHEPEEVEIVKKYLSHTDAFINIGANQGYYCCIALQEKKKTIAFEPIDSNLKYLYANMKANGWENDVEIFPIALSDKSGLIEIYGGGTGASLIAGWAGTPKKDCRLVPVSRLDDVLGERLTGQRSFFLVDIEGAEIFMLEGAKKQLCMNPKPIWMMEISISEHQPEGTKINPHLMQTFQMFWQHGYEARTADKAFKKVSKDIILKICEGDNSITLPHNFLFMEDTNV